MLVWGRRWLLESSKCRMDGILFLLEWETLPECQGFFAPNPKSEGNKRIRVGKACLAVWFYTVTEYHSSSTPFCIGMCVGFDSSGGSEYHRSTGTCRNLHIKSIRFLRVFDSHLIIRDTRSNCQARGILQLTWIDSDNNLNTSQSSQLVLNFTCQIYNNPQICLAKKVTKFTTKNTHVQYSSIPVFQYQ